MDSWPVRIPALQATCDALGPADVQAFFDRWSQRLPWPMTRADRAAGYDHRLAICQLEVSLTDVFDRPVQGRHFFEALIRENLDLGRPNRVALLFPFRIQRTTPPPVRLSHASDHRRRRAQPGYRVQALPREAVFQEQHALRTETTINNPNDFYVNKGIANLSHLRDLGHQVNRKVLEVERVSPLEDV